VNCRVFLPVSTGIESIKIDQETPELLTYYQKQSGTFFMAHGVLKSKRTAAGL